MPPCRNAIQGCELLAAVPLTPDPRPSTLTPVIIDFHTHIFPPDVRNWREDYVRRDPTFAEMYANPKAQIATAEDLLASMDEAGVDVSVALGFAWRDQDDIVRHNDYLRESAAKSNGRIIPFTTINMSDGRAEAEIERCAAGRVRGLGEMRPDSQGWALNGEGGETLADLARKFGLILLFHVTEPGDRSYPGRSGCEFDSFRAFAERHPDLTIVGAHLAGGFYAKGEPTARPYVDTAAQPFLHPGEDAAPALARIPADRLLFGSDLPLISQSRQIAELRTAVTDSARLEAALGGNARKLLGL
jgi:predicted TIM-barrel fold metal-dependent hydrolase